MTLRIRKQESRMAVSVEQCVSGHLYIDADGDIVMCVDLGFVCLANGATYSVSDAGNVFLTPVSGELTLDE